MDKIEDYWWMIDQGLGGILEYWAITLFLCILFVLSMTYDIKKNSLKQASLFISFSTVTPFAIAFIGAIYRKADQTIFPSVLVLILWILPFLLCIKSVIRNKKNRITKITALIFWEWISFWIAFTSMMSIADDWL